MKKPILIMLASAAVTGGLLAASPAPAQTPVPTETRVSLVRTADLDLGSAAGRRQLEQRLAKAAREVCGTASDADVEGKNEVRRCRDETLASAKVQEERLVAAAGRGAVIAVSASR